MFFIPLILTAGLDLSLPEFQPELDASGNYIVAEYDDVSGTFEVKEVRELPYGLTAAALAQNEDSDSGEVIYNRDGSGTVTQQSVSLTVDTTNYILVTSGRSHYIQLLPGYTYTITTDAPRIFLASDLVAQAPVTVAESNIITPSSNLYAIVGSSRTISATFVSFGVDEPSDPSGNDSSGNDPSPDIPSPDVSGVIIELQYIRAELSMKLRIIIFVLIWQFILPLAMKIRDHIFNLKHD